MSADLGSSSNYSNELQTLRLSTKADGQAQGYIALKTVVEKVSLRVALMQGSVGPKHGEKSDI